MQAQGRDFSFSPRQFELWLGQQMLRRSKIFIATALKIAISSVGAASNRAPLAGICIVAVHRCVLAGSGSAGLVQRKQYGCKSVRRCWP
jgi:hypothetical protein